MSGFYGLLPRLVSFALALAMTVWILILPTDFAGPGNEVLRILLGPAAAWLLLIGGAFWFLNLG